jgi:hypothetical protein
VIASALVDPRGETDSRACRVLAASTISALTQDKSAAKSSVTPPSRRPFSTFTTLPYDVRSGTLKSVIR